MEGTHSGTLQHLLVLVHRLQDQASCLKGLVWAGGTTAQRGAEVVVETVWPGGAMRPGGAAGAEGAVGAGAVGEAAWQLSDGSLSPLVRVATFMRCVRVLSPGALIPGMAAPGQHTDMDCFMCRTSLYGRETGTPGMPS